MSAHIAWSLLFLAGLLDVAWAISMKQAQGYTRPGWTVVSILLLAAFVYLLGRTLQVLPVGTAYAVWTGIGAVGTVLAGIWLFGVTLDPLRLAGILLVMGGIALLKLAPS
jgi:quaternary ammonium compound-resistance protein SugE